MDMDATVRSMSLDDATLAHMGLRSLQLKSALNAISDHEPTLSKREKAVFEINNLTVSYGSQHSTRSAGSTPRDPRTIGPLSFSARFGEVIGIIGENGAGKTTLSRLCCGLEKEDRGTVSVDGRPLSPKERLGRIRLVMQDPDYQLFSDSVLEELSLGGRRDAGTCERALRGLGLWDMRDAHPATLSRGQKQRLTIACALVDEAAAYFFDEPTSGLDRENMERVASGIRLLARSGGIVFAVSHDCEFLLSACDHILRLRDGLIVDDFALDGSVRERLLRSLWRGGVQWNAHTGA